MNAVHPSIVRTPMVAGADKFVEAMEYMSALKGSASLEDVAHAVMFLASDEAGYLTGLDLPVDGGFTELGTYRQVWRRATGRDKRRADDKAGYSVSEVAGGSSLLRSRSVSLTVSTTVW